MRTYKKIYWRPDMPANGSKQFANVHLLVGYNQGCITDYQKMAAELRKTFPQAKDCDLHCSKVQRSSYCNGFTLLSWNAAIERKDYPGWTESTECAPEYWW